MRATERDEEKKSLEILEKRKPINLAENFQHTNVEHRKFCAGKFEEDFSYFKLDYSHRFKML